MNILILGGAGFIGSNLASFFVNTSKKTVIFDRKEAIWQNLKSVSNKITTIKGDFNDAATIEKIFNKNQIDIVIHLISSAIPATPFNKTAQNTELASMTKLLDIMRKKGVNKIVFFSSGGAIYGENKKKINTETSPTKPINFYGQTKLTIEKYIQMRHNTYGLNYIILRPSNAYGKNQNIYGNQGLIAVVLGSLIRNKKIEIWGDGKIIRDYIYIDDLCRALLLLVKRNKWNDVYNVGSEKGTSVNEVLQIIKKITGINFNINYKKSRKADVPINILNALKINNSINWGSLIGLEKGIEITWQELKNKY